MTVRDRVRTFVGLVAAITLLALIVADTVHPRVTLSWQDKALLVSLISTLLGVDLALEELPVKLRTSGGQDDDG